MVDRTSLYKYDPDSVNAFSLTKCVVSDIQVYIDIMYIFSLISSQGIVMRLIMRIWPSIISIEYDGYHTHSGGAMLR